MKVSDIMVQFDISGWRKALFWSVNIPRYLLGMDLVIYRCMVRFEIVDGFKKATIELGGKD